MAQNELKRALTLFEDEPVKAFKDYNLVHLLFSVSPIFLTIDIMMISMHHISYYY